MTMRMESEKAVVNAAVEALKLPSSNASECSEAAIAAGTEGSCRIRKCRHIIRYCVYP
jgi:hypothetical protein